MEKHSTELQQEQVVPLQGEKVDEKADAELGGSADVGPKESSRETWAGRFDFILSCIGYCIGLGNVWRFPYLCYKNGGGAFLVPYLIMVMFLGIPMYFLELSVGQYHRTGALGIWSRMPAFKGVGFSQLIVTMWCNCYYPVVMAWSLWYLFHSFSKQLPWSTCDNDWNTDRCVSLTQISTANCNLTNSGALIMSNTTDVGFGCGFGNLSTSMNDSFVTSESEFWLHYTLDRSDGINNMGKIRWQLALLLVVVWIGCYLCIWKGIKWSGKVVYVTAVLPYILIVVLLIRAATLPGAGEGIRYFLNPNPTRLLDSQVWIDAASQVCFSSGVGYGVVTVLGSFNKFNHNSYVSAVSIVAINSCTSILCGFAIFAVLGFLANTLGKSVADVTASGPGLAFIVYPSALAQLPGAPFWACLFFLMLFFVGLDTEFCMLEGFFTSIIDEFPKTLKKRREIFIAVVCVLSALLGLSMVSQGGIYMFQLFEWYAGSRIGHIFVVLFESIAFGWFYGGDSFYDAIQEMIGYKPIRLFKYCWKFIIPALCLSILVFSLVTYTPIKYDGVVFPGWTEVVGWFLTLSCVVCVPLFIGVRLLERRRHGQYSTTPRAPKDVLG